MNVTYYESVNGNEIGVASYPIYFISKTMLQPSIYDTDVGRLCLSFNPLKGQYFTRSQLEKMNIKITIEINGGKEK